MSQGLSPRLLEPVLERHIDIIEKFTWLPFDLSQIDHLRVRGTEVVTSDKRYKANIYGVQPSLFDTWNTGLLLADTESGSNLFFRKKDSRLQAGMARTDQSWAYLQIFSQIGNTLWEVDPAIKFSMAPGFTMSDSDISNQHNQAVLVSLPNYAIMSKLRIQDIPYERLVIKLKDCENLQHSMKLRTALAAKLPPMSKVRFRDRSDYAYLDTPKQILEPIFTIAIILTLGLAYLNLSASVHKQLLSLRKEIGILRAMGLTAAQIQSMFTIQAFLTTFTTSLLGVMLGFAGACLLQYQQAIFLNLPLTIVIPWL